MQHATAHDGSDSDSDANTEGMDFHGAGEMSRFVRKRGTFHIFWNVADNLRRSLLDTTAVLLRSYYHSPSLHNLGFPQHLL